MNIFYLIFIIFYFLFDLYSLKANCLYQPSLKEGYIQIWNINHHSKQIDLFITFLISNLGKGDFNNGVTIYINNKEKQQSYTKMLEFTNKYLQAKQNELNISLEKQNRLIYKNNKLFLEIHSQEINPEFEMNINIEVDFNQSLKSVYQLKEKKISYEIVYMNPQMIDFKFYTQTYNSFGVFGLECLHSEENILDFAENLYFFRNYEPENKIAMILLDITGNNTLNGNFHISNETYFFDGTYNLDGTSIHIHGEQCRIQTYILEEVGGFFILSNVSKLLQWFLKLIGINPYIKHYISSLNIDCLGFQKNLSGMQFTHIHF